MTSCQQADDAGERAPLSSRLVRALRDDIVHLAIRPGDTISEADISARYGMSRQPVREAFIRLAQSGLLLIRPKRATMVRKISEGAVRRARFIREAIEVEVLRRAAAGPDPTWQPLFEDVLERQSVAARAEDFVAFHALDELFHRMLARMAGLEFAWDVIEDQKFQLDRVRFLTLAQGTPLTIQEHRRMIEAIMAGRAGDAEAVLRLHAGKIETLIARARAAHPDYFSE